MTDQAWVISEELECPACGGHQIAVAVDETCRCLTCGTVGPLDDFDPERTQPCVAVLLKPAPVVDGDGL